LKGETNHDFKQDEIERKREKVVDMAIENSGGIENVGKSGSDSLAFSNSAYFNQVLTDIREIERMFPNYRCPRSALYSCRTKDELYSVASEWRDSIQADPFCYMSRRAGPDSRQPESMVSFHQLVYPDKTYVIDRLTNTVKDIVRSNGPDQGVSWLGYPSDIIHTYGRGELLEAGRDASKGVMLDGR
jgi:hypothetical protein